MVGKVVAILFFNSFLAALRDAREGAMKDKKKYQGEVERIKVH